jgi:hypothetical protein
MQGSHLAEGIEAALEQHTAQGLRQEGCGFTRCVAENLEEALCIYHHGKPKL